jgi:hypothetical protein
MINFSKIAKNKSLPVQRCIHDALRILAETGLKIDDLTPRRLERIAMCFLALIAFKPSSKWRNVKKPNPENALKTRDIITYINENFEENISLSSYDDIRRKDLIRGVQLGIFIKSANNENADNNDGTRGYSIEDELFKLLISYETENWENAKRKFPKNNFIIDLMKGTRSTKKIEITLPNKKILEFEHGPHNQIQKAIIDEFLPRFGFGADVYYISDTTEKAMVKNDEKMKSIGLNSQARGMLPDIVAYSENKNWLYLIEAVHSSNPLNTERLIELSQMVLKDYKGGIVLVTAFLTQKDFQRWAGQIAWESEVWIANHPDHMIHFNGDKFLGPHKTT